MQPLAILPKQQLVGLRRTQTLALADVSLRGHGARKKLNSHFLIQVIQSL